MGSVSYDHSQIQAPLPWGPHTLHPVWAKTERTALGHPPTLPTVSQSQCGGLPSGRPRSSAGMWKASRRITYFYLSLSKKNTYFD